MVEPGEEGFPGLDILADAALRQFVNSETLFDSADIMLCIAESGDHRDIQILEKTVKFIRCPALGSSSVSYHRQALVQRAGLADQQHVMNEIGGTMHIDCRRQDGDEYDIGLSDSVLDIDGGVPCRCVCNDVLSFAGKSHLPGPRGAVLWWREGGDAVDQRQAAAPHAQPAGAGGLFIVIKQSGGTALPRTVASQVGGDGGFTAATFGIHDSNA